MPLLRVSSSRSEPARQCPRRSCSCRCSSCKSPPAAVPVAVAAGFLLGEAPRCFRNRLPPERLVAVALSAWHAVGAAAVFALAGEPSATPAALPILAAALVAQYALELITTCIREVLVVRAPVGELVRAYRWVFAVDTLLDADRLLTASAAIVWPAAFLLTIPLLVPCGLRTRADGTNRQRARTFTRLPRDGPAARRRRRGRRRLHGKPQPARRRPRHISR